MNCSKFSLFCPLCIIFSLHIFSKNVLELTVVQTFTVPNNSKQISCTPKSFSSVCIYLKDGKSIPELFNKKNPRSLETFRSATSISIKIQATLLRNSRVKIGMQKDFYVKEKSSPVNKQPNMKSVLVQPCNCSQHFYHYVLHQDHVVLHVV